MDLDSVIAKYSKGMMLELILLKVYLVSVLHFSRYSWPRDVNFRETAHWIKI